MTYVSYRSSRTRDRSPLFDDNEDYYSTRRLAHTNSKRARSELYDDEEHDDYPYSNNRSMTSRAMAIHQPFQLEKYNIWSRPLSLSLQCGSSIYRSDASDEEDRGRIVRYKTTDARHSPKSYVHSYDENEREFHMKFKAMFARAKPSHSSELEDMAWSSDMVGRKKKWIDEEWEATQHERGGRDYAFDDGPVEEKSVRFRRVKRTRTDEWKPLSGWKKV